MVKNGMKSDETPVKYIRWIKNIKKALVYLN